jgi:hypothetical protein
VLIDRTHKRWAVASAAIMGLSVASYGLYRALAVSPPSGGSVPGLVYGSLGSALMLFAGALGARRRVPTWRIGRATTWMRGHLWLGFISFPLILLHSGFSLGAGSLTRTLMVLFILVFVSGLFGAAMQVYVPKVMTERVPLETVYDQIGHIREQLAQEALTIVDDICAVLDGDLSRAAPLNRAAAASAGTMIGFTVGASLSADPRLSATVRECYVSQLAPYLVSAGGKGHVLSNPVVASGIFHELTILVPERLAANVGELQSICEEKRQLDKQRTLHHILHGWLIVHVPLSYALLILGGIHALVALRY